MKDADGIAAGPPSGDADMENRIKRMRNACRREMRSGGHYFCRFAAARSGGCKSFTNYIFF
ncbi:hypothetical protein BRYFOR_07193 [Marvinbryantia formatexigens DSM 14469]|uniref:Uncharacterized protein n=1 Tax=Marvinbryantia formatexigens DSM 14469 TaxID=478749 RepID=C6LEZ2_9FIRM|nr:hypothetical protein BRYFOR_07193 [Marvinbryantia formatexigens DSM 14469]